MSANRNPQDSSQDFASNDTKVLNVTVNDMVPDFSSDNIVQKHVKQSWKSYFWDTFDKSAEERRFLFKLDAALLTFATLGFLIKYLDQINVNNAFVSGMKEDLRLFGNELNYMQTCWTVGYVLGEIPRHASFFQSKVISLMLVASSNLILTRVRPSIWIPACEVTWATLTILLAVCTNTTQLYILRFFIGLAESTFYPGMQYIIGSWYRKDELAKRSCIFQTSSAIGAMFSGYLMAAVYHLNGVGGFHGWQWLFIVNTIISLPIALAGFFFLPDYPSNTRAFYLNHQDKAIARKRMELEGRSANVENEKISALFTTAKAKKFFTSWHIYMLSLLYIFFINGCGLLAQPAFSLWLKIDQHYGVEAINAYPTLTNAAQVITTVIYACSSDSLFKGARWPPIVVSAIVLIVVHASLAAWDIPTWWHWTCYILAGFGGGVSGLCFAWAHEICNDDLEERALVTGTMNEMAYVFQAWLPLLIWKQVEAPKYRKGMVTMIGLNIGLIAAAFAVRHLHHRELHRKEKSVPVEVEDSQSMRA